MQIPIMNGIYADRVPDFRTSYPHNLMPIPKDIGIAEGYLKPHPGLTQFNVNSPATGTGRGGVNWNGVLYRVIGTSFCKIDSGGNVTVMGTVAPGGQCKFDNSFELLAIAAGGTLFYFDGTTVTQNTDSDLGLVLDVIFVDGRFMTTDGESLVITELGNPYAVDPIKYGSSEFDPDPVNGLLKYRNEVVAFNRYTIESFRNILQDGFPWQRIDGAVILKGAVSATMKCEVNQQFAFVGGGKNKLQVEAISVYIGSGGVATKIATREIDQILAEYSEAELASGVMESRLVDANELLYIHLPRHTLVYDVAASIAVGQPVWFTLGSQITPDGLYRARNFVYCYGEWTCDDAIDSRIGVLDDSIDTQYGAICGQQFDTMLIYNEARGGIIHKLELVGLTGRSAFGINPQVFFSFSRDGVEYSTEIFIDTGGFGDRTKRPAVFQFASFERWISIRVRMADTGAASWARMEAEIEGLTV